MVETPAYKVKFWTKEKFFVGFDNQWLQS